MLFVCLFVVVVLRCLLLLLFFCFVFCLFVCLFVCLFCFFLGGCFVLCCSFITASLAEWFKASAPKAEGPEFESRLRRDFSGSGHTSDLKIGTSVATLPGALGLVGPVSLYCDWVRYKV